ncbi:MAG: amino acid permease [Acidobacteria bacterium]|jgi:APA family basic amino acid/polyamine antiporter|nr:amino acid permease [Acidobacteriota bacterium]
MRKNNLPQNTTLSFKKSLNLFDSTAIVAGSMIGSGIFIVSADMARTLGSPGWLIMAWIITGILTIFGALSYGELAALMPQAGGKYVYLREAYNPLAGFLYGWTLFLVIQTGTIAAVAMAFAKFLGVLVPWFSEQNVWLHMGFLKLNTVHIGAICVIIFLTWVNTRGITAGKYIQNVFSYTKIGTLLAFIIIGFFIAKSTGAIELNTKILWDAVQIKDNQLIPLGGFALIAALGVSLVGPLFSSDAWYDITFAAGEVKNPKRTIPMSLFLGVSIVIIIYLLVNVVYLMVLPLRGTPGAADVFGQGIQFAANDRLGTATMHGIFGENAAFIMAIMVMISTFGCVNGLVLSGPRVYYAMANDGLFFKKVGSLNKKRVPSLGLVFQGIWASILCLSGTYSNLLDYVIFAVLIFFAMTVLGIFILRKKRPDAERPYKAFGYPIIPALYIVSCVFIMLLLLIYKPYYTWPGLIIVLLGIPVYFFWKNASGGKGTLL